MLADLWVADGGLICEPGEVVAEAAEPPIDPRFDRQPGNPGKPASDVSLNGVAIDGIQVREDLVSDQPSGPCSRAIPAGDRFNEMLLVRLILRRVSPLRGGVRRPRGSGVRSLENGDGRGGG